MRLHFVFLECLVWSALPFTDGKSNSSTSGVSCFSGKIQIVTLLGFARCVVFIATTQLCHFSAKALIVIWTNWLYSHKIVLMNTESLFYLIAMCQEIYFFFFLNLFSIFNSITSMSHFPSLSPSSFQLLLIRPGYSLLIPPPLPPFKKLDTTSGRYVQWFE